MSLWKPRQRDQIRRLGRITAIDSKSADKHNACMAKKTIHVTREADERPGAARTLTGADLLKRSRQGAHFTEAELRCVEQLKQRRQPENS